MTDFELIYLFNEFLNTLFARLNDFMVGLFAIVVAGYFVAAKLSRTMAWLVAGLYTIFSLATIVPTVAVTDRFLRAGEMVKRAGAEPGSDLSDLIRIMPGKFVMPVMMILLVVAYAASLIFFFQARRKKAIN
jgi:hypothetical protein